MGAWVRRGVGLGMVLGCGVSMGAQAQSLPAVPSAQSLPTAPGAGSSSLPSAPGVGGPSKPLLVVPPVTYTVPDKSVPAAGTQQTLCYGPREGVYAVTMPPFPAELRGAIQNYTNQLSQEIFGEWRRHMTRAQRDAWARQRVVTVRMAVMPDGSIREPEVTVSSGKPEEDAHALDAVKSHGSFGAPPKGYEHPVLVCLRFGYNMQTEDMDPARRDEWEKKP